MLAEEFKKRAQRIPLLWTRSYLIGVLQWWLRPW